jgi:hypothetical protein
MSLVPYTLLYLLLSYGFFDIQLTYQKKKKKSLWGYICVLSPFFFFFGGGAREQGLVATWTILVT